MATILDLYKDATKNKAENELYGKDSLRIESRGLVNIPRQSALLASSPNSVADLIGGQVAGLLGGNATRPSDTIFKDDKPFRKPVTIAGGLAIIDGKVKDAIQPNTPYFVKQSPSPASFIQKVNQGTSNPLMTAANIAVDALKNPLATKAKINSFKNTLNAKIKSDNYGASYTFDRSNNIIPLNEDKGIKFSKYAPYYAKDGQEYIKTGIFLRGNSFKTWDSVNNQIISSGSTANADLKDETFKGQAITRVEISEYGRASKIILPGTISGISEDFSPEWTNFKYIGSPFYNYRYTGIERSIKFNIKLYYTDEPSKQNMIKILNKLKTYVHPYSKLSTISYGTDPNKRTEAIAFSPVLINFSITGLYTNLFGFIEELSISIDDNVSWATMNTELNGNTSEPYPTVIDVSIGIKIIPEVKVENNTYVYNFDSGSIKNKPSYTISTSVDKDPNRPIGTN